MDSKKKGSNWVTITLQRPSVKYVWYCAYYGKPWFLLRCLRFLKEYVAITISWNRNLS